MMASHKHVMILDRGDDGRWWFWCKGCPAQVDIVPSVRDANTIVSSARVRHEGVGGFSVQELLDLAWCWLGGFRSYAASCRTHAAPARRRRRRAV